MATETCTDDVKDFSDFKPYASPDYVPVAVTCACSVIDYVNTSGIEQHITCILYCTTAVQCVSLSEDSCLSSRMKQIALSNNLLVTIRTIILFNFA